MAPVIALARYAAGLARARVALDKTHICKRAHVTRTVSRRAFQRWDEDKDKTVPMPVRCCWCRRPANPINARRAR